MSLGLVGFVSCATLRSGKPPAPTDSADWRQHPRPESEQEIETLGTGLAKELIRLSRGTQLDDSTRRILQRRYDSESLTPIAVPQFILDQLTKAYSSVPQNVLNSLSWEDSLTTAASRDVGVLINRQRAVRLSWIIDSLALTGKSKNDYILLVRRPGDYGLLLVLAHEFAHLALDFSDVAQDQPSSVLECGADILGAFHAAASARRISHSGVFEMETGNSIPVLGSSLMPGDWVSRNRHPDSEQREACLRRGLEMFNEQLEHKDVAGASILESRRDSLIDDLSLGRTPLVETVILEARSILSLPGDSPVQPQSATDGLLNDVEGTKIVSVVDTLLQHLHGNSFDNQVLGSQIQVGVSRFPSNSIKEVVLHVSAPWKCAGMATLNAATSVGCYAITSGWKTREIRFTVANGIARTAGLRGYSMIQFGVPTQAGASLSISQWLLEGPKGRAIVSLYGEPYKPGNRFDTFISTQIFWFSVTPLPMPNMSTQSKSDAKH